MSKTMRITVIFVTALILAVNIPLCAFATDPVSAATMANALAQAITAYGASQGVSMTFDVADTDGIGEGVHELWDQFIEDINDPNTPTYDSLAVTMWSNLYSKIGNNLGINISASEMPFIDSFWNWVLSGPAEMSKVDNQYFEWNINDGIVNPIDIYQNTSIYLGNYICYPLNYVFDYPNDPNYIKQWITSETSGLIIIPCKSTSVDLSNRIEYLIISTNGNFQAKKYNMTPSNSTFPSSTINGSNYLSSTARYGQQGAINTVDANFAYNNVLYSDIINEFTDKPVNPDYNTDSIGVQPYIGDATPQNVYIPDNTDVNYNPTDVAIPLDIPWDNTLFGDGDGVLTDAQSEAAASAADEAIADSVEKTLTIADTENPDIPAPNEVYIPLLPVELPSFNFSLSGIWYYVVSWVQSLGAWLSLMFQTWAVLPSAITIPVYATAVIVIVLGVYKRFFM